MTSGAGGAKAASPDLTVQFLTQMLYQLGNKNNGVWRGDLVDFLGTELCAHLHIGEDDGLDDLRAKLIWHLRRAIRIATKREKQRLALAIRFNITEFPELQEMEGYKERAKWCQKHHQGPSTRTIGTLTSLDRKGTMLPTLAQELAKPQPVPPQAEIDEIIDEFEDDSIDSEIETSLPIPETSITWLQRIQAFVRSRMGGDIVSGTIATLLSAAIVAVVIAVVTQIGQIQVPFTRPAPKPLATIPPGTNSPIANPTVANPPAFNPPTSFPPPVGIGLRFSTLKITDGIFMWKAVFPQNALPAAQEFLNQGHQPVDPWEFLYRELDAGAYVADGIIVDLLIVSDFDSEVTIYNARPIVTEQEIPAGAFIALTHQGGGSTYDMEFNLDDAIPVAKESRLEGPGGDFFSAYHPSLRKGETVTLEMKFSANRSAYSFSIEIHYEVGGQRHKAIVDRNGLPFRVTPSPCKLLENGQPGASYDTQVRYNKRVDGSPSWGMVSSDLRTFCLN